MAKAFSIVGGETLLGRELRELLKESRVPARLKLISGGDSEGREIAEEAGEAVLMEALGAEAFREADVVFLAGAESSSKRALELLRGKRTPIIDLTGALEENPAARLRAPMIEPEGYQIEPGAIHVIAQPAAIALATFMSRLHSIEPLRRSVILVLEPVSERGKPGLDELHHQTVKLLSFQNLDKTVFDAQVSFNLLPEYGEDAPKSLASVERRIDKNLASLLALRGTTPMPSLRVVQAPVFHGYSFSIWAEFEREPAIKKIEASLRSAGIEVRASGEGAPTNVGSAGQSGITAGSIMPDHNAGRAVWFWVVTDNLRLSAENASEVARALAE